MEKPYDEKRLARAVHDILRSLLSTEFAGYYARLSSTILREEPYSMSIPTSSKWQYKCAYIFNRSDKPDRTTVIITFDGQRLSAVRVVSDVGSYFEEQAKCQIKNKLLYTYYGYFDTDMAWRHFRKQPSPQLIPTEIQYALHDIFVTHDLQVQQWPKENLALKQLHKQLADKSIEKLSCRNERIRSTLTAIVEAATREILQEAPPSVREYIDNIARIEFEDISIKTRDNKLTVAAKYVFVKKCGTAEIANIGIRFKDEFLTVDDVWIFTEPYAMPQDFERCFPHMLVAYITRCIERDFCRMVNAWGASEWLGGRQCEYCKDEKEKKEMTTAEASYIYDVKMTSEMKKACDKLAGGLARLTYREAYREAFNSVYGTAALSAAVENKKLSVKEIVINEPAMIVFWEDGTKTVVTAKDEAFDAEKGLAMAFAKKALGNNYAAGGRFKAKLKHAKWAPKKQEKKKDIFCEENLRDDAKEIMEGAKKPAKEKPIAKTAWIKSMMEEGFTRSEATKAWEKKHQK